MNTNTKDLNPNGDGDIQPDTDPAGTTNNADAQDKSEAPETNQSKPAISEARLRANRENAQKSTGPRTARGKKFSSRNAVKHGLLLKRLLFSDEGEPIHEELHELYDRLHEKYGKADIRTQLLVEGLVVEHWRQRMALEAEMDFLKRADWHFCPQGNMPNLQRYRTASQHTLLKNLELLDETAQSLPDADENGSEAEGVAPASQTENPRPAPAPRSGRNVVAVAQNRPKGSSRSQTKVASSGDATPADEHDEAA